MIQPFEIINGLTYMKYTAWFISDTSKKELPDIDRYMAMVKVDPLDKVIEFECECKSYIFSKGEKKCKHILELEKILKEWKEINE